MQLKGYKTTLRQGFCEGVIKIIEELLQCEAWEDDDKLVMAALAEVKLRLEKKMLSLPKEFVMTFTPTQAIALRILYTDYLQGPFSDYMQIHLQKIANEVHKQFSK